MKLTHTHGSQNDRRMVDNDPGTIAELLDTGDEDVTRDVFDTCDVENVAREFCTEDGADIPQHSTSHHDRREKQERGKPHARGRTKGIPANTHGGKGKQQRMLRRNDVTRPIAQE